MIVVSDFDSLFDLINGGIIDEIVVVVDIIRVSDVLGIIGVVSLFLWENIWEFLLDYGNC